LLGLFLVIFLFRVLHDCARLGLSLIFLVIPLTQQTSKKALWHVLYACFKELELANLDNAALTSTGNALL